MTHLLVTLALTVVSLGTSIGFVVWGARRLLFARRRRCSPMPFQGVLTFLALHVVLDLTRIVYAGGDLSPASLVGIVAGVVGYIAVAVGTVHVRRVVNRLDAELAALQPARSREYFDELRRRNPGWLLHLVDLSEQSRPVRDYGGDPNELPPWARPRPAIEPPGGQP